MRLPALLGMLCFAACASAGVEQGTPDASKQVDAAVHADAAIDALVNVCPSSDTCTGATMLGSVSGDTANQKLSAMGYQAAWYRVRVTEDNSSAPGLTLHVAAKLTSPTSVPFDVFVYVNSGSDVVECSTTLGTVTTAGTLDTVKAEWGEGFIPNGSDDGRNVSIEIRPTATGCAPAQMWQLEIEGNWL